MTLFLYNMVENFYVQGHEKNTTLTMEIETWKTTLKLKNKTICTLVGKTPGAKCQIYIKAIKNIGKSRNTSRNR